MNKIIIPIILGLIILGIGYGAFNYYNQAQMLTVERDRIQEEKDALQNENNSLKDKYAALEDQLRSSEDKYNSINQELTRISREKDSWQKRYEDISGERDALVEKLNEQMKNVQVQQPQPKQSAPSMDEMYGSEGGGVPSSDAYWADFVKNKVDLEAKLGNLTQELMDVKGNMALVDKQNKELSIKMDDLNKEKEALERDIAFKTRTLDIMSRDLVKERETRKGAVEEMDKIRNENISLKRELVLTNKEKIQIQAGMDKLTETKLAMERKIGAVENILKEKAIALQDLQDELGQAVNDGTNKAGAKTSPVELPPIVVKPSVAGVSGLRGEVIAVNADEKFVVTDLGEATGVRPGMRLNVKRGDQKVATLEVIETRGEISAADIKEFFSGATVQEGDVVTSE